MRTILLTLCFLPFVLFSQNTAISGVLNAYEKVNAADICTGQLLVDDTAAFPVGTRVIVIQMQGAQMNESNSTNFGNILDSRMAGFYEINEVDSLAAGQIFLKNQLLFPYNNDGSIQIIDYPSFADATVTDTLMPKAWDGATGGILAFEVTGTLTLDAPIIADAKGFRGGQAFVAANNNCTWILSQNDYSYSAGSWRGANKGEGITQIIGGKELGRGAQTIGGGGGNDHNSGGGGGGNRTDGGRGGENDEPSTFGCDGDFPGIGGKGLDLSLTRLFMGGGGGAGHSNNNPVGKGGAGGGIVFVVADAIMGSERISAIGAAGEDANGDGGGGGGAGGTILLRANSMSPSIEVLADGGLGGNTRSSQERCFGPGGGGAGGYINSSLAGIPTPQGAVPGSITNSAASCQGQSMGAANGQNGESVVSTYLFVATVPYNSIVPEIQENPTNNTLCTNETALFSCRAAGPVSGYQWQRWTGTAWVDVPNSAPFSGIQTANLAISPLSLALDGEMYRCVVSFGDCAAPLETASATLEVRDAPTALFASTTLAGNAASFTNQSQNYTSLLWDFGDGATSTDVNPNHSYASDGQYNVTLTVWNVCDTVMTSEVLSFIAAPLANFAVADTLRGCGTVVQTFSNQSVGTVDNLTWLFPNASPSTASQNTVDVTYASSGTYSATLIVENGAGRDTLARTFYVDIQPLPTAQFQYTSMGGTLLFSNQSQNTTGQLWDFGDANQSADAMPTHNYTNDGTYTVTLTTWNDCDTVMSSQVVNYIALPTALFTVADTIQDCSSVDYTFSSASLGAVTSTQWFFPNAMPSTSMQPTQAVTFSQSGTYEATLIVANTGGMDTLAQSFYVDVVQFPTADFSLNSTDNIVQFFNESLDFEEVSWNFGDGTPAVIGENNPLHTYAATGDYVVTLSVSNSCGASVLQQTVTITDLVSTIQLDKSGFQIYPNPTQSTLFLDGSKAKIRPQGVRLYSSSGILVYEKNALQSDMERIDVADLPQGVYILRLLFADKELAVPVIRM